MYFSRFFKHLFWILVWAMLLFLVVILYYYALEYVSWTPKTLGYIEMLYNSVKYFLIAGLVWSIIGTIFYKIRHSRVMAKRVIKRFLPIIHFSINTLIAMVSIFMILEAIGINTKNIATGAWIGGAIFVLAYKDLFTNLLGSLSILLSRNFEIGDTIRVRTVRVWVEWMVEEITLNHIKITNKTGEVIYVPNKIIYSEPVENLSRRRFFSYEIILPIAKTTPFADVQYILNAVEAKINSFFPVDVEYMQTSPNAWDFMYTITVKLPKENKFFETEMRDFMARYIFSRGVNFSLEEKKLDEVVEWEK